MRCGAATTTPEAYNEVDQHELKHEADDRRQAAEAAEAAAEQHAEQTSAEEAGGETASMPIPGRLKKPPAGAVAGAFVPGWVMVRFSGCAAFGAVGVVRGARMCANRGCRRCSGAPQPTMKWSRPAAWRRP
jgi:hypothetical protein